MKKTMLFLAVSLVSLQITAQQNLLSGKYSTQQLQELLIPIANFTPFPRITDRAGWTKASTAMMQATVKQAESYLTYQWPSIPATTSLLIERTGDREKYERVSFEKRNVLGTLVLAEVFENKGRFTDAIINGIWSICEESFWGVPAHLPRNKEYSGLMDVSQPFVELFSAETATFLAWADYFVGDKLDAVSPQIRKRIYYETNNRIFQPLMNKPHGWMAASANGRPPNNWNPWICSNWLNAALLLEKDATKRTNMIAKLLTVLDAFVNPYPQDGGCDEGPGYWGAAAASLYDNISMLNLATNNAFSYVYDNEKIKNMARFIYRAQISENYFLDFADADPQPGMAASMIYRFGEAIRDTSMMQFGAFYRKPASGQAGRFHYFRNLFELFMQDAFQQSAQRLPLPADAWFPGIQVMIARDKQGTTAGLFVAAQGGHNDESHNHNDVGNYIVYYNGAPVLIDVGRGTYTRKTFSDKRYEIWFNCSDYHNTPTINGANQLPGAQYKANQVAYTTNKTFAELSLNIAAAYPEQAGITSWQRAVRLNRGKNVVVKDLFTLKTAGPITEHLMTCYPAEVIKPGELVIHYQPKNGQPKDFVIQYNARQMQPTVEKVALTSMEDKGVQEKWGDNIYRINFAVTAPKANDAIQLMIAPK
ncbi:heparinase [Niastella vici]|uniref:Heparinase n=1 Tax=Niastella vici TaxID=1703345 RepID=A0A1V9G129_9BACT|nr:heparinase II/III family protein [Niastella vici]OQP64292.1 heparinase [Niastella vici]